MQNRKPGDQTGQPIVGGRNIRLTIAFDGTAYRGWQIQKDALTIQGLVTAALERITGAAVTLTGSGRTDAGTHARGLVAHFHTLSSIPPSRLVRAVNCLLPRDIRVLRARTAPPGFHARHGARGKVYRYQIYLGAILAPHLLREYFHYPYPVDVPRMRRAAAMFTGEHDFASFAKTGSADASTVRTIRRCDLTLRGRRLHLTVEGNGFLHHMVRNMAGTLLEVGRGAMTMEDFALLFKKRDRASAGFTAPAHGLVLLKVRY